MSEKPVYDFMKSVEEQKPYSEQFAQWIESRPKTASLRPATLDEDKTGIDFFVTTTDDTVYTVQLKVDFIFFFLIPSRRLISFRFNEFLKYTIQHYETFRNFAANNKHTNSEYRTLGCLIPISKVIHLAVINITI